MDRMDLAEVYDRYAPQLYRHALAITHRRDDAEDAVQAVFLKLASLMKRGSAVSDPEAYLHVAVRREAVRLRERKRLGPLEGELVAAADGLSPEEADEVRQALRALPVEQSEVVLLHLYEGMPFRRVAELLEIPPDTAASRYRYAIAKLKEWFHGRRGISS